MRVVPFVTVAIGTKNGKLSLLIPGYAEAWILSFRAINFDGRIIISHRRVRPLLEKYIFDLPYFKPIFSSFKSSRDRKSIGQRVTVKCELVTIAAEINIMDSVGSSLL